MGDDGTSRTEQKISHQQTAHKESRMKSIRLLPMVLAMIAQSMLAQENHGAPTFADDVSFLRKYVDVIVLSDQSSSTQVAVIPAYQCRVITSTAGGADGISYGWVNRDLISSGEDPAAHQCLWR